MDLTNRLNILLYILKASKTLFQSDTEKVKFQHVCPGDAKFTNVLYHIWVPGGFSAQNDRSPVKCEKQDQR